MKNIYNPKIVITEKDFFNINLNMLNSIRFLNDIVVENLSVNDTVTLLEIDKNDIFTGKSIERKIQLINNPIFRIENKVTVLSFCSEIVQHDIHIGIDIYNQLTENGTMIHMKNTESLNSVRINENILFHCINNTALLFRVMYINKDDSDDEMSENIILEFYQNKNKLSSTVHNSFDYHISSLKFENIRLDKVGYLLNIESIIGECNVGDEIVLKELDDGKLPGRILYKRISHIHNILQYDETKIYSLMDYYDYVKLNENENQK